MGLKEATAKMLRHTFWHGLTVAGLASAPQPPLCSVSFYMLNNLLWNSACQVNCTIVLCKDRQKRILSLWSLTWLIVDKCTAILQNVCPLWQVICYIYKRGDVKPLSCIRSGNTKQPSLLLSSTSINSSTCRLAIKPLSQINIVVFSQARLL